MGATHSILPPRKAEKNQPIDSSTSLTAVNGTRIKSYGTKQTKLYLLQRPFTWNFIIADVTNPILGADFLGHHGLLADIAQKRSIDIDSFQSTALTVGNTHSVSTHRYNILRHEFPDVFKPELRLTTGKPARHGIYHHITTRGPPTHAKFRRLPPDKLHGTKQSFQEMERMGILVNPDDIPKTAIITPFGTYVFAYSTFGLKNAGAPFQRLMDSILEDLPFCCCYVDDILIFLKLQDEHLQHVRTVLRRLQDNGTTG
ncbi:uncharacterized protein [Palaemon carinicauda]|uniref:uncharacterized protein n=1 Tax=Palaemon carinicauda TaxID=392227 RepID=UPI0035B66A73